MTSARHSVARFDNIWPLFGYAAVVAFALLWTVPFLWMVVSAFRPAEQGAAAMASLVPDQLANAGKLPRRLGLRRFPPLLPQHGHDVRRHSGGAD